MLTFRQFLDKFGGVGHRVYTFWTKILATLKNGLRTFPGHLIQCTLILARSSLHVHFLAACLLIVHFSGICAQFSCTFCTLSVRLWGARYRPRRPDLLGKMCAVFIIGIRASCGGFGLRRPHARRPTQSDASTSKARFRRRLWHPKVRSASY